MGYNSYQGHGYAFEKRTVNGYITIDEEILKQTKGVNAADLPEGWMINPNNGLPIKISEYESASYQHREAYRDEIIDQMIDGSFELKYEDIDISKIANTAERARNGEYLEASSILTQYWNVELKYYYRDDGTIRVETTDGVPLGFITTDTLLDSYSSRREEEIEAQKEEIKPEITVVDTPAVHKSQYSSSYNDSTGSYQLVPNKVYDNISGKIVERFTLEVPAQAPLADAKPTAVPAGYVYDRLTGEVIRVQNVQVSQGNYPSNIFYDPTNHDNIIRINEDGTYTEGVIAPLDGTKFDNLVGNDVIYLPNNSTLVVPGLGLNRPTSAAPNGIVTIRSSRLEYNSADGKYHLITTNGHGEEQDVASYKEEDVKGFYIS